MSHIDTLTSRLRNSLNFSDNTNNKPDFRDLDPGSPVSTLRNSSGPAPSGLTSNTSSSSSSSGSASGRTGPNPTHHKRSNSSPTQNHNHSGELSGSVESSPTSQGRCKRPPSDSANSPSPGNVLPAGNICPSGKILKSGMVSRGSKTDVLGSGSVNYGHGSIMRGGGGAAKSGGGGGDAAANCSRIGVVDPEELKRLGNEQYKTGNLSEALGFYDRAIAISPGNATYRFNKAVALMGLKRLGEAVREYEEAVRLDAGYVKAHHRLGSLLVR